MLTRVRNALHALFNRNPTVTIEVMGSVWACKWQHMAPEDAARLLYSAADAAADRAFTQAQCSATVH